MLWFVTWGTGRDLEFFSTQIGRKVEEAEGFAWGRKFSGAYLLTPQERNASVLACVFYLRGPQSACRTRWVTYFPVCFYCFSFSKPGEYPFVHSQAINKSEVDWDCWEGLMDAWSCLIFHLSIFLSQLWINSFAVCLLLFFSPDLLFGLLLAWHILRWWIILNFSRGHPLGHACLLL